MLIQKMYKGIIIKGVFKRHQVTTNYMSKTLHLNNQSLVIGQSWQWGLCLERVKPYNFVFINMLLIHKMYKGIIIKGVFKRRQVTTN